MRRERTRRGSPQCRGAFKVLRSHVGPGDDDDWTVFERIVSLWINPCECFFIKQLLDACVLFWLWILHLTSGGRCVSGLARRWISETQRRKRLKVQSVEVCRENLAGTVEFLERKNIWFAIRSEGQVRMMSASGIHHFWLNTEQTVLLCLYENPSTRCPTLRRTIYSRRPQRGASPFNEAAHFCKNSPWRFLLLPQSGRTSSTKERTKERNHGWMPDLLCIWDSLLTSSLCRCCCFYNARD